MGRNALLALTATAVAALLPAAAAAQQVGEQHSAVSNVFRPEPRPFDDRLTQQLSLPDGFEVGVFARDLGNPRMMAVAEDGTVYVTRTMQKDVIALRDGDGDGRSDGEPRVVTSDLDQIHGIAIRDGRLYLATVHEILAGELRENGSVGTLEAIVDDLPGGGQHHYRTLGFAPDGALHINSGSSCNSCFETTEEKAANLRMNVADGSRSVFAHGLRNMLGFDWHPETGEMWGVDHGVDHRGDETPPEELNRIREGAHYGWPFCYGDRQPDWMSFTVPQGMPKDEFCATKTEAPAQVFPAHSSPIGIAFYDGEQFPDEYRNDALVTLHGSFNREEPSGYKIVRVRFENGEPTGFEDFLTGFLVEEGRAQFGRPTGLAVAADGSLLVSDDANGMIYRVSHAGGDEQAAEGQPDQPD